MTDPKVEVALLIINHDGVARRLMGQILDRVESRGLQIVGMKFVQPTREMAEGFFPKEDGRNREWLLEYFCSGPVLALAVRGVEAAARIRLEIAGGTCPSEASLGTIRGDYSLDSTAVANREERAVFNLIHVTNDPANVQKELTYWFRDEELIDYKALETEACSSTIGIYELLAPEFDLPHEHDTVRVHEALSREAWADCRMAVVSLLKCRNALELGCGTGTFSEELYKTLHEDCSFTFVDSARTMVSLCRAKLRRYTREGRCRARVVQLSMASADTCLPPGTFDFVAACLGDPFLRPEALKSIPRTCVEGARLFVTVPEREWAERQRDLIESPSTDKTVFHDILGRTFVADSLTFTEGELRKALEDAGFLILQSGSKNHRAGGDDKPRIQQHPPRIVYALAQVS